MNNVRSSETLTRWVRHCLHAQIAIALISMYSNYREYQLLDTFQSFGTVTIEAAEASYARRQIVAIVHSAIFIISGFLILRWIHRANYNARSIGAQNMKCTPGWAIGWFFVPVAAIWKPYEAMKEIWKASHAPADWQNVKPGGVLGAWWFLWLATNIAGEAAAVSYLSAVEIHELMNSNLIYLVSDVLSIPLAIITLILVNQIVAAQKIQLHMGRYTGLQSPPLQ